MSNSDSKETWFAPRERASDEEVASQHHHYASLTLVQQLIDALPNAFLILNEQRQAVLVNRALLELIAADEEDAAIGKRLGEMLNCAHAFDVPNGCGTTEFCRECGAAQAMVASLAGKDATQECRIMTTSGQSLDLRVWGTALAVDGKPFSMFAVEDIGDEKRRRYLERIFFHDILNTASGIALIGDMMKDMRPEEIPDLLAQYESLVVRLISEIKSQKDLSAAEGGELIVVPAPTSANNMLNGVHSQYAKRAANHHKSIEVHLKDEDVIFDSDAVLVGRVLGNMVKNALEAIAKHEVVTLRYDVEDGFVVFDVHNPGCIPRHVQLQIFQRSFSTKGEGRGLGTYSIKLLTERYLQGRAGFVTSPDKGTHFHVAYPLVWTEDDSESVPRSIGGAILG